MTSFKLKLMTVEEVADSCKDCKLTCKGCGKLPMNNDGKYPAFGGYCCDCTKSRIVTQHPDVDKLKAFQTFFLEFGLDE